MRRVQGTGTPPPARTGARRSSRRRRVHELHTEPDMSRVQCAPPRTAPWRGAEGLANRLYARFVAHAPRRREDAGATSGRSRRQWPSATAAASASLAPAIQDAHDLLLLPPRCDLLLPRLALRLRMIFLCLAAIFFSMSLLSWICFLSPASAHSTTPANMTDIRAAKTIMAGVVHSGHGPSAGTAAVGHAVIPMYMTGKVAAMTRARRRLPRHPSPAFAAPSAPMQGGRCRPIWI